MKASYSLLITVIGRDYGDPLLDNDGNRANRGLFFRIVNALVSINTFYIHAAGLCNGNRSSNVGQPSPALVLFGCARVCVLADCSLRTINRYTAPLLARAALLIDAHCGDCCSPATLRRTAQLRSLPPPSRIHIEEVVMYVYARKRQRGGLFIRSFFVSTKKNPFQTSLDFKTTIVAMQI